MQSWKTPTPEAVAQAAALLAHPQKARYFFDRLHNPLWIAPLHKLGWFKTAPPPIEDRAKGTVQFVTWPASQYLARMAQHPEVADLVLTIASELSTATNVVVLEDIADVALALDPARAALLASSLLKWSPVSWRMRLPAKLGLLVSHLGKGGEPEAALKLADTLLRVVPDPRDSDLLREAHSAIDSWSFQEILRKHVPDLIVATGLDGLRLLCNKLEAAVRLSQRASDSEAPEDYSESWRPNIASQRDPERTKDALVSATRAAAVSIVARNPESLTACIQELLRHGWTIFRRLTLDLVRTVPEPSPDAIAALALTENDLQRCLPEYKGLLGVHFGRFTNSEQLELLTWIERGPDIERWRTSRERWWGERPSEADAQEWARFWRYERLWGIRDHLVGEQRLQYVRLEQEFGALPDRDVTRARDVSAGPSSPQTPAELQAMGPDGVVAFLQTWEPTAELGTSSAEGLATVLVETVAAAPNEYAERALDFQKLRPVYVNAWLRGLKQAAAGSVLAWPKILSLIEWVLAQPPGSDDAARFGNMDTGGGWSRNEIARLLDGALQARPSTMPFELRRRVWDCIAKLTNDPEPSAEYEAAYGGTNMDPATLAINTVRGLAFAALMRYALWVREHLPGIDDSDATSFSIMPEVRDVLDRHLDPLVEGTVTVRSVYGQWFPWLILLDCNWAQDNRQRIFDEGQPAKWDAAWNTYIVYCHPFDSAFTALAPTYQIAITKLRSSETDAAKRAGLQDPSQGLVEHLMVFWGRAVTGIDQTLELFWSLAPPRLRAYAISFVGRSLERQPEGVPVPAPVIQRFMSLWDSRLKAVKAGDDGATSSELEGFGSWFASGAFPTDWSFAQVEELAALGTTLDERHRVAERLLETATTHPSQSVVVLRSLVQSDKEGWELLGWDDEAGEILRAALGSDSTDARRVAVEIIHELGNRGQFQFGALLKEFQRGGS